MPPFHSRSTGARSSALTSSLGASPSPRRRARAGPVATAGSTWPTGARRRHLRDGLAVVVGPGRAGQVEEALAFLEGRLRVGIGVQEHVLVVERADQLEMT